MVASSSPTTLIGSLEHPLSVTRTTQRSIPQRIGSASISDNGPPPIYEADGFVYQSHEKKPLLVSPPPLPPRVKPGKQSREQHSDEILANDDLAAVPSPTSTSSYAPCPPGYSVRVAMAHSPGSAPYSFSRHPPPRTASMSYSTFHPMFVVARSSGGKKLENGFTMSLPPLPASDSDGAPKDMDGVHPFARHDINEVDWLQFLAHLCSAASLTERDKDRSNVPIINRVPILKDITTFAIQKSMLHRKLRTVIQVVDDWNHHFFEPRRIRVILMRGSDKLSGHSDKPISDLYKPARTRVEPSTHPHFAKKNTPDMSRNRGVTADSVLRSGPSGRRQGSLSSLSRHGWVDHGDASSSRESSVCDDRVYRLFVVPL